MDASWGTEAPQMVILTPLFPLQSHVHRNKAATIPDHRNQEKAPTLRTQLITTHPGGIP